MPPTSTYRIQFHPGFGFAEATKLAGYCHRLGVGALYASPLLTPAPGSQHGYDVVDPSKASPELGGEEGRVELAARLRDLGLGFVVDVVPNHMAIEPAGANPWWSDVLARGRESGYANYFDVDFDVPEEPGRSYRRFFDIDSLAAVRVEDPEVFDATHGEVLRWVAAGDVTGLRVDHPDGLSAPGEYFRRLRARAGCWIVAEKILMPGESLPATWSADGTTGYDALRETCGAFVDPAGEAPITELAESFGVPTDFPEVEHAARRLVTDEILLPEVRRIAPLLPSVPQEAARAAVAETMAAFGVYRSYLPEHTAAWAGAIERAHARRPELTDALATLDSAVREDPSGELATRIQQTSGMVVAKGTEDTALYRATRFVALNEVGGAPESFGLRPEGFHAAAAAREAAWPTTMTTVSTHDTKRSEDVRARLAVLSEIPDEWASAMRRWTARAGLPEPSLNHLAWQTLLGAWPIGDERLAGYLGKAAREAKLATGWTDPDPEFEEQVRAWPERVSGDGELRAEVEAFVAGIEGPGWSNSLGQKLLQLAGPGVPDIYQGTECWDYSLVDPDNRRPVDLPARERMLERLESGELPRIDASGAAKLHVVRRALRARRERAELFRGYRPLSAEGSAAEHALAFARSADLVAVATRLPVGLERSGGWRETVLPLPGGSGEWTGVLTDRRVGPCPQLAELLDRYPVALLLRDSA
jgi:(1->4)-alpha-D-glucan 1-alpha-D-glucosylmutase